MSKFLSKSQWRIIILSSLGGMLEFYDFILFVIFAAPIGQAFFPSGHPIVSTMAAYTSFAIGYLARPFGGILFSHFGDKYGRKRAFLSSVIIMGIATLIMGSPPPYQAYGIAMPTIFILCRIIQGLAIGAEIPGAVTFVSEHAMQKTGQACSMILFFVISGILLADAIFAMLGYAFAGSIWRDAIWRFAFIFGGIFAIVSYFLRRKLYESPEYLKFKDSVVKIPFLSLIRNSAGRVLCGILLVAPAATIVVMVYMYLNHYMQISGQYNHHQISYYTLIGLALLIVFTVFWGWISNKISWQKIYYSGGIWVALLSYPYYLAILHHHHLLLWLILISIGSGMLLGIFAAILSRQFPVAVRYSGVALSYNISTAIFSGLTPLISTYLIYQANILLAPAWILIIASLLGVLGISLARFANRSD